MGGGSEIRAQQLRRRILHQWHVTRIISLEGNKLQLVFDSSRSTDKPGNKTWETMEMARNTLFVYIKEHGATRFETEALDFLRQEGLISEREYEICYESTAKPSKETGTGK